MVLHVVNHRSPSCRAESRVKYDRLRFKRGTVSVIIIVQIDSRERYGMPILDVAIRQQISPEDPGVIEMS